MSSENDPIYVDNHDMSFDTAKPVSQIPMLAKLQSQEKARITIRIDQSTLAQFKEKASQTNSNYQTLINQALKEYLLGNSLQDIVKSTIRQELRR